MMNEPLLLRYAAWVIVTLFLALFSVTLFTQGVYAHLFLLKEPTRTRTLLGRLRPLTKFMVLLFVLSLAMMAMAFPFFGAVAFTTSYAFWILIFLCLFLQSATILSEWYPGYTYVQIVLGWITPFLFGCFLGSCFNGAHFYYPPAPNALHLLQFYYVNPSGGLDILLNSWNMAFGFLYMFLTGHIGFLYLLRSVSSGNRFRSYWKHLFRLESLACFCFLCIWIYRLVAVKAYGIDTVNHDIDNTIRLLPHKIAYVVNENPWLAILLLLGHFGIVTAMGQSVRRLFCNTAFQWAITGTFLYILAHLLILADPKLSFYPSSYQPSLSLTIANSAASLHTLYWFLPVGGALLLACLVLVWFLFSRLLKRSVS